MKTDKNFRLSKPIKTMMALMPFRSQEDRNGFKRAMIDAELSSRVVVRSKKDKNEKETA